MELILNKDNNDIFGVVIVGNTTNYIPLTQPADYNWFFRTATHMGFDAQDIKSRWMTKDEIADIYD